MDRYTDSPAFFEALDRYITRPPPDDDAADDAPHCYDAHCPCDRCLSVADQAGDA